MSLPPHLGRFSEIELCIFKTKTCSSLKDTMCSFAEQLECCPGNAAVEVIARPTADFFESNDTFSLISLRSIALVFQQATSLQ